MNSESKFRGAMLALVRRLITSLVLLLPLSAPAIVLEPLSVNALSAQADIVLHGVVLSNTCQRDPSGRIYTKVELRVTDIWKGAISGSPFVIVHGGGVLGDRQASVPAQVQYDIGEEVVAFLVRNERGEGVTVGLMQGKFRVWQNAVGGTRYVVNPFHGVPEQFGNRAARQGSTKASAVPAPIRLTDLKRQVQEAHR